MSKEFGKRPDQEPRSQRGTRREANNIAYNRLPALMQDDEAWSERSHEEMVDIIKHSMEQYREERDPESRWFNPVDWMRDVLISEISKKSIAVNKRVVDETEVPHARLQLAWEVISQPYIKSKFKQDRVEVAIRSKSRILGRTITLDPNESKLLDAMADACGIPKQGEQKISNLQNFRNS